MPTSSRLGARLALALATLLVITTATGAVTWAASAPGQQHTYAPAAPVSSGFEPAMLHVWLQPTRGQIDVAGRQRTYLLHLPPGFEPGTGATLVLAFHGQGGTGDGQQGMTHMSATADAHGFVVVYPDGLDRTWHYGRSEIDDLAFVDALIDHLQATLGVDLARVYVTGMSNGGFFATYLACARPERIAAVAPVAASLGELQRLGCLPAPPLRIQMIAGTADPIVPWDGNAGLLSVPDAVQFWIDHNNLPADPVVDELLPDVDPGDGTRTSRKVWGGGESQVALLTVMGGGHTWPGGLPYLPASIVGPISRDFDASEAIWEFFSASPSE